MAMDMVFDEQDPVSIMKIVTIKDCRDTPSEVFTAKEICEAEQLVSQAVHGEGLNPEAARIAFVDKPLQQKTMMVYVLFSEDGGKEREERQGRSYLVRNGKIVCKEFRGKTEWF